MGVPVVLLRRAIIIKRLARHGALSPSSAKTLGEVGILNPNWFPRVTEKLIKDEIIARTGENKYYLIK